jgi:hypothetical protein
MAVIINDFEVIMEPPKTTENAGPASGSLLGPAPAPSLRPDDILRVQRHYEQRQWRLLAD